MPAESSPSDRAVFVFLDGLALALLFAGVDWVIAGKGWLVAGVCFVLAFALALIAHNWQRVKSRIGARLSYAVETLAADYRYRLGSLFFATFVFGTILLSYVSSTRRDVDMFLMPRVITTEQTEDLKKALVAAPSDTVVTVFVSVADKEALSYAGQLFNAVRGGGWNVRFQTVNPWDADESGPRRRPLTNIMLALDEGLVVRECLAGQPINPDPRHPSSTELLIDALRKAKIEVAGNGSNSNCGEYSLSIEVGRRPPILGDQTPLLSRIGRWLMQARP